MKLREVLFVFYTTFKNGEASDHEIRWFRNSLKRWCQQWWDMFIAGD